MTAGVDLPFTKDPLPQNFNSLAISLSQSTAMSKRKADIQLIRRGKSHSEPPVFTPNTACSGSTSRCFHVENQEDTPSPIGLVRHFLTDAVFTGWVAALLSARQATVFVIARIVLVEGIMYATTFLVSPFPCSSSSVTFHRRSNGQISFWR